jgi:hypothetical protein
MMAETGSATIVERGANENRFHIATNIMRGTFGKQWSINGDDRGVKTTRNVHLSASGPKLEKVFSQRK